MATDPIDDASVTIYPEWKQAVIDAMAEFDYGDTITHEWLYKHFDIKKPEYGSAEEFKQFQFLFLSYVESFKAAMLEQNKMYLVSARGIGYLIVEPEAQTSVAWDKLRSDMTKNMNKAHIGMANVLIDRLSDEARRENSLRLATLAAIRAANNRALEDKGGEND